MHRSEDTPRCGVQSLGAQRGGQAGAPTDRDTHERGLGAETGPRMHVCCTCVCVNEPAARRWACTHVYPGRAPAAWIALQGKTGQSLQAPVWPGEGAPHG